jgi:4-amino-4-deoxy-L-arabinose transferase-like glycosyltransferase
METPARAHALWWLLALAALTGARLLAAAQVPLAPDEAYYWVWGRHLQAGYLDHPPMVALWIAAGTALLGDTALGVRLLAPLGVGLATLGIWRAGEDFFPGRGAGLAAAILLNGTLLFGAGAVLITPDTPLLVFWCATIWAAARLAATGRAAWWLAIGALAGAALLSKYTAAFLGLGLALWLLLDARARPWLATRWPWLGGALALLLFSPVLAWNAAHDWASFAKQGGRTGDGEGLTLRFLGELLGGQLALATPIVFVLCVAGVAAALRHRREGGAVLLLGLVLPAAALFLWQSLFSRVQGNWPAILYPAAALAAGAFLGPAWQRWVKPGAALGLALTLAVLIQATLAPLPLARRHDPTLARLGGWSAFAADIAEAARVAEADFVAAEEYGLAALLAFHLPREARVIAMDARWAHFGLQAPAPLLTGVLVRSERRGEGPPLWPGASPAASATRARDGIEAERYRLFLVRTGSGGAPAVLLPRPR